MDLYPKLCAVLTAACCLVAPGSAYSNSATGSSANLGKWWIETAKAKSRQRAEAAPIDDDRAQNYHAEDYHTADYQTEDHHTAATPPADGLDDGLEAEPVRVSRYGYDFAEHKSSNFHILYRQQDVPARVVRETGELLETAYRKFLSEYKDSGFVLSPISGRLPWVVFNDEDQYRDFARISDGMTSRYLESYYAARTNQVVLMQASGLSKWKYGENRFQRRMEAGGSRSPLVSGMDQQDPDAGIYGGGGMLDVRRAVHEAAHQLAFNTGLQKRGVMYPLWVSEGLATNFECDSSSSIGVAGENAPRQRQLLRAHSAGRLMPLQSFVTMVQIRPGGKYSANDLYAQSWALFNYLFKHRRAELQNYLARLARLEAGPRDTQTMHYEFTSAFGSIERLERGWDSYLNSMYRD